MDRSWSPTRHQAAIVGHRRAGRGSTRRVTERSLARGTCPEAVSSGMGPLSVDEVHRALRRAARSGTFIC